jgi:hypothetical protein
MKALLSLWKKLHPIQYVRLPRLRPVARIQLGIGVRGGLSRLVQSLLVTFQDPVSSCGQVTRLICTGRLGFIEAESSTRGLQYARECLRPRSGPLLLVRTAEL